jgi:hypothetical protein
MAFREWSAGDFGGPAEGASPWGSPSPGPEKYAATDKEWFSEALAISSAKVVSSVADKIVDHDGMMLDEFNNVVSDLGDEMRAEMKELRAELRALVVAKVSAQEKEIRELRGMVLSLAKKIDGGRASSPPPPPPARKAKGDGKSPQAPSYAQAAAPRPTATPSRAPSGPRESQPKPRPVQQGDVAILQRPLPSTIPDSQPMEGIEFSVQSLNASKYAPATIPIPSSPPPSEGTGKDKTVERGGEQGGDVGAGLRSSQHAPPLPPMDPEMFRVHPDRRAALSPTGQDEARERAESVPATESRTDGEREGKWTTVDRRNRTRGGGGRGPRAPTYAQAAGPAPRPAQSSPPAPILTPLAGHAASTTQDSFWIQWIFPAIDDGKVSCDEVKKQLRKNEVTRFLTPGKSEFQYANRALLSKEYLGGWYVAFPVRRGPAGQSERDALHKIRSEGLKIFGKMVKPRRAYPAKAGTLCTVCCQFGHNPWRCFNRPPKCTLCSGKHWWRNHKCVVSGCQHIEGTFCETHDKLKCAKCGREHHAGSPDCAVRPKGQGMGPSGRLHTTRGGGSGPPPSSW